LTTGRARSTTWNRYQEQGEDGHDRERERERELARLNAIGTIAIEPRTARIVAGRNPDAWSPWKSSEARRDHDDRGREHHRRVAPELEADQREHRDATPVITRVVRSGSVPGATSSASGGRVRPARRGTAGGRPAAAASRCGRAGSGPRGAATSAVERGVVVLGRGRGSAPTFVVSSPSASMTRTPPGPSPRPR
jgi:hypothetical protein